MCNQSHDHPRIWQGLLICLSLVVIGLASCRSLRADEPPADNEPDARIRERDRLSQEAHQLQTAGKLDEAIAAVEKTLLIERKLFPEPGDDVVSSLKYLGTLQLQRDDFAAARRAQLEVLHIVGKRFGEQHWRAADARRDVADVDLRSKLTKGQRRDLAAADDANRNSEELYGKGQFNQGIEWAAKALEIRKKVLGAQHPRYATSLNNLAALYYAMGDYARAEPLYKQALEIRKKALGEQHPHYAISLNNLAGLYKSMGDYARAEPLYKQALEIRKKALGELHPDYATSLNNLAGLYYSMGDYARTEPLCKQALETLRKALGELHPDYANSLNHLAVLYYSMGDYARAEPLYKQALEIRKKALGEQHPGYAESLNNLAMLDESMGDYARAELLYKQALDIDKKALGEQHPDYAADLSSLAGLYKSKGDHARAEPLLKQALEIRKTALGELHPGYAESLNNLAFLYDSMGDHAQAEPLYKQGLEIRKKVLGEQHPDYAIHLNNMAVLYYSMGDYARAEPLAIAAVHIVRNGLELTAVVQSERQQLVMNDAGRGYLNIYLSIAGETKSRPEEAYSEVLAWKGAVSARQAFVHRMREAAASRPEVARLFGELEQASREFAARSRMAPAPARQEAHRRRLAQLSAEIEGLEQRLAGASAEFRKQLAQRQRAAEDVANALPPDFALIDLLEYRHFVPPQEKSGKATRERRVVAFVVRHDQPIVRVDLGPAEPIRVAVEAWRRRFAPGSEAGTLPSDPAQVVADPANAMRQLVWEKLAPHVKEAGTLLISPDGALARFPWPALLTNDKSRYLIEDKAIVIVPIPQMLPDLLAAGNKRDDTTASLLLVGDVDYGAAAGAPTVVADARSAVRGTRGGSLPNWDKLPNTRTEIVTVRDSFEDRFPGGDTKSLRKDQPTEEQIRELASKYRYLHLATHGFFAPPELRSALAAASRSGTAPDRDLITRQDLAGFHPGLLSGIVLAGANHEVVADKDDGILTALEVAQLNLGGVELATLSACETGLGETAGGEGLLGLQRAFQTAGARSVVASLWKLKDDAARQLMIDFYDNLWSKKMSKVEALRQAQLTMLRDGLKRGAKRLDDNPSTDADKRTPPDLWAAFELSGDWR